MKNLFLLLVGFAFLFLFIASTAYAQPAAKAIVDKECAKCHNIKRVYGSNKNAEAWKKTVDRMIKKGAGIKPQEKDAVIKYLSTLNK